MRIASSMLRPVVVSFLDEMLRTDDKLRVEEIAVRSGFAPRALREAVPTSREYVLLAVRVGPSWEFNPQQDFVLQPGTHIVVMATPQGRRALEAALSA
jgi:voltage-gated potassium channel